MLSQLVHCLANTSEPGTLKLSACSGMTRYMRIIRIAAVAVAPTFGFNFWVFSVLVNIYWILHSLYVARTAALIVASMEEERPQGSKCRGQ